MPCTTKYFLSVCGCCFSGSSEEHFLHTAVENNVDKPGQWEKSWEVSSAVQAADGGVLACLRHYGDQEE